MPRDELPAYSTLRAFVAAARCESVRAAADELGVTPSAVSHQIRILEDWVGQQLFLRTGRQIQLTARGRTLFRRLDTAFRTIAEAATTARAGARDRSLRISALPLIASSWLIPRLQGFQELCAKEGADVAIEIDTSNALADFETDGVDVAIRSAHRPSPNLISHKLIDLRAVPLCATRVAEEIKRPSDLSRATLIHISARPDGWQNWLAASGNAPVKPRSSLSFDTVPAALEAAAAGRGLVLGLDPIVWDAPIARNLVIPFRTKRVSAGAFFVTYRRRDQSRWIVKSFTAWILQEMQQDKHRLLANSRDIVRKQSRAP
ncbi:LysR family transcriptional regulator [Bradyrhizobium guangdongense]|nr:LysR family transcriptional regulator [Bradyrhizobium guangdongense]